MAEDKDPLKSIYNDLGLEKGGVSFDKFSAKMQSDANARKSVYKDLGLETAGVTYDRFETKLGIKKKSSGKESANTVQTSTKPLPVSQENTFDTQLGKDPSGLGSVLKPKNQNFGLGMDAGLQAPQTAFNPLNQPEQELNTPIPLTPKGADAIDPLQAQQMQQTQQSKLNDINSGGGGFDKPIGNEMEAWFAGGVGQLGSMVAKIPSGILDIALKNPNNPMTSIAGLDAEQVGKIIEKDTGLPEEYNPISPNNALSGMYKERANKNLGYAQAGYDKGITDYLEKGDFAKAGKLASGQVLASLPVTLGIIASRGAGAGEAATMLGVGVGTMSEEYKNLKEQNPNIDRNTLFANAVFTGASETLTEYLGTNQIFNYGAKLLKTAGKEAAEEAVKKGLKSFAESTFKKAFVGAAAMDEGLTEGVNTLAKNWIDRETGVRPDAKLMDGVMDSFIVGIGAGGLTAAPFKGAEIYTKKQNRIESIKLKTQLESLLQDADNPNLDGKSKLILTEKIGTINEKLNDLIDKSAKLPESVKAEAVALLDRQNQIAEALASGELSPASTEALMEESDKIDDQLEKIDEQPAAAEEVTPKPIATNTQLPTIQPNDIVNYTNEAGEVLQVPVEAINENTATIGYNNEGIYETREVPLQSLSINEEAQTQPEQGVENIPVEETVPEAQVAPQAESVPETVNEGITEPLLVEEAKTDIGSEIPADVSSIDLFKIDGKNKFYHASTNKRKGRLKQNSAPQFGKGIYFSTNKDLVINEFGEEVTEVELNVKKPLYTGSKDELNVKELAAEKWNKDNLTYDSENDWYLNKKGDEVKLADASDIGEIVPIDYYSNAARELGFDVIVDAGSANYENEIVVLDESKIIYNDDKPNESTTSNPTPTNATPKTGTTTGEVIETGNPEESVPTEVVSVNPVKNLREKAIPSYKDIRTNDDTPETLANTVNSKTWYHGSGKDLTNESVSSASFSKPDGLLGLGFYMTDNPSIAETYSKLRRNKSAGIINEFKVKTSKILDAEKPIDTEVANLYKDTFRYYINEVEDADVFFENIKKNNPSANVMDYHKALTEFLAETEMPVNEVYEAFQDLEAGLKDNLGYDAISHIGGVQTKGEKHNVIILLDPSAEYSTPKNYFEKKALYNKYEEDIIEEVKENPVRKKVKNRTEQALSNDPRSFREAILQYFLGGGTIKTDDFIRITGFGYKTNKAGNKVATDELRKAKFLGFVKDNGEMADMILMNYVPEAFQKDSGMDLVSEIADLAATGTKGKMLSEIESINPDNTIEISDEEIAFLVREEQTENELSEMLIESDLEFLDSEAEKEFYQNITDEINATELNETELEDILGVIDDYQNEDGTIDWERFENDFVDLEKNGFNQLLSVENKSALQKLTEYGSQKSREQIQQRSQGKGNTIEDSSNKPQETTADRAGKAIDKKIADLDKAIVKQKSKIQNELDKLSSDNDMFAAAGVNDGTKAPKLFDNATNTETENINRIIEPLQAELDNLIQERDALIENKESIIAEAEKQQDLFNQQSGTQDAQIIANSMNPLPKVMGAINKFQEQYIARNFRKVEDILANNLNSWLQSKNYFSRNAAQIANAIFNGMPRSQANLSGKLNLTGGLNKARYDAKKALENLYAVVNGDTQSLERIHEVIDPTFYIDQGLSPVDYKDLSKEEQILHDELRKILDGVHRRNFALGFINKETYEKFKGIYSPRLYETFEIPDDVQTLLDEQMRFNPVSKLDLGQFKGRKEVDELSEEAKQSILKDPVYGAVKRLMQLDQNAALAGYINDIIADNPQLVKDPTKVDIPKGFVLMSGKGYGKLDGKYVPNYIAEDFKGFFMLNSLLSKSFDLFKGYDKIGFRQFLKKSYTVYNPVVQLGNFISNFTFAFAAGVDPVSFATGLPKAYKALKAENTDYQTLLRNGILGTDIVSSDLLPLQATQGKSQTKPNMAMQAWNYFDENTSKLYGMSDEIAKMNAFLIFKEQGFTEKEAIQKVYEGFQNYATVGKMWDYTSKAPLIGNPFIKFQADLFRILKNGATKTPLTTSMYLASLYFMPQLIQAIGLGDDESEDEKDLRTSRSFIPKVPLGITNIPLVFKTRFGEVNLARYISPFFLFDTGNDNEINSLLLKLSPIGLVKKEEAGKGNVSYSLAFSDPLLGTLSSTLFSDTDFRGKSIQDPDATRFRASGATPEEKIANKATFLARSWVPQGSQIHDFYLSQKYGEDFYGRTRTLSQSLINMVVKVQDWKDGDYKKEAEKRLDVNLSKIKSITDERSNIIKGNSKKIENAYQDFDEKRISKEQLDQRLKKFNDEITKRIDLNTKDYEKSIKDVDDFIKKYEEFLK